MPRPVPCASFKIRHGIVNSSFSTPPSGQQPCTEQHGCGLSERTARESRTVVTRHAGVHLRRPERYARRRRVRGKAHLKAFRYRPSVLADRPPPRSKAAIIAEECFAYRGHPRVTRSTAVAVAPASFAKAACRCQETKHRQQKPRALALCHCQRDLRSRKSEIINSF